MRPADSRATASRPRDTRIGRFLRALAVTLPLGLDPHVESAGAPAVTRLPAELIGDEQALGAIGVVWTEGRVCAAVGLRQGKNAPRLGHLHWRPSGAPSRATVLTAERLPDLETPRGFEIWSGCSAAPEPRAGASLSALLIEAAGIDGRRRRVDLPSVSPGTWAWRVIHPFETTAEVLPPAPARAAVQSERRGGG